MVDYGKGPSKSEWATDEELLNTGAKGWNYLQRLPEVLQKHIPWLREYIMAFAIDDDVDEFSYQGWRPMRSEHFGSEGLKNFNQTVGYRFNLSDVDGVVRYKKQVLMLMPKDIRKRQMNIRNEAFENYYAKVTDEREPYVHPLDSRKDEMREAAKSEREEGVLKHDPDMEPGQIRKETKKHKKED
jgi:hypothetical protein